MKNAPFKKLQVWKDGITLCKQAKVLVNRLKSERDYALSDQLWRSCISIVSNIAEGSSSGSNKNFIRYLNVAYGSLSEFRCQLTICWELESSDRLEIEKMDQLADSIGYRILRLKRSLE